MYLLCTDIRPLRLTGTATPPSTTQSINANRFALRSGGGGETISIRGINCYIVSFLFNLFNINKHLGIPLYLYISPGNHQQYVNHNNHPTSAHHDTTTTTQPTFPRRQRCNLPSDSPRRSQWHAQTPRHTDLYGPARPAPVDERAHGSCIPLLRQTGLRRGHLRPYLYEGWAFLLPPPSISRCFCPGIDYLPITR